MKEGKKIYIIGFMGSGKTTTGKKLAASIAWNYADLDTEIELQKGLKIREIFSDFGEDHFRQIESVTLHNLNTEYNTVISTGGGTPCFSDNMDFMKKTGSVVYLKMTPEQLKSRLDDSSQERPLIKELAGNDLLEFIREKLAYRERWYGKADIIFSGFNVDIKELINQLSTYIVL